MSLREGAETVVNQCLNVQSDENVLVLNDGNDQDLIDSLLEVLEDQGIEHQLLEYEEPDNHGEEPPEEVKERMKEFDVFIAPTVKSISHTDARKEATEAGVRGATLPGANKEIWNSSLTADYNRVEEITEKVYNMLQGVETVRIKTSSGTDLEIQLGDGFTKGDGRFGGERGFGNLPAGEVFTVPANAEGHLHIEQINANGIADVRIQNGEVKEVLSGDEDSELVSGIKNIENAKNVAEFGFGTNPEAEVIGKTLQDEKVLGTVHIALGNSSVIAKNPENAVDSEIHWDNICLNPTVWFDGEKVLDGGEPTFL